MSYPVADRRGPARVDPHAGPGARVAAGLYGLAGQVFHRLHDRHMLPRGRAAVPVVSIGAVTVGGAGKTPVVRWLAARLVERGRHPAILTRGYRSQGGSEPRVVDPTRPDALGDGDEPTLLARSLPDVPVVVAPDRRRAARVAAERGADVILLDDGFQHRRLHRDADVVLWDVRAAASQGRLAPAGWLRESPRALRRADLVILVDRGNGAPPDPPDSPPAGRVFRAKLESRSRQELSAGAAVHALSGIADPESFERALGALGLRVVGATRHDDHHPFSRDDVLSAATRAEEEGADHLAVTAKDRIRWPGGSEGGLPVPAVFDLDVRLESGDLFLERIDALLEGSP